MTRKFLNFIFLCFVTTAFSQTNTKADQYLIDQNVSMTVDEIIKTFTKSSENWDNDPQNEEYSPFISAMQQNVFNYFSLNEQYGTDLKKSVFKKTSDYKTLSDSLNKLKSAFLKTTYYQIGLNNVYDFSIEYDMKKKGFMVAIGNVLPYHCLPAFLPKVIGGIKFGQLNIFKKYNLNSNSNNSYTQYLFVPMPEEQAIELENQKDNVEYLLVFNVQGFEIASYNDADFIKDHQPNCKATLTKGGDLRFIIYNEKSKAIYSDKLYKKNIPK